MRPSPHEPATSRRALYALTGIGQALFGVYTAYVAYVLIPHVRETFEVGPAVWGRSLEPLFVPVLLAVVAALLVRRYGRPALGAREVAWIGASSLVGYYAGFWAVGIPTPTPGAIPLQGNLAVWQLFEPSPYLPLAWSTFLAPAVEGAVAVLAGVTLGSLGGDR